MNKISFKCSLHRQTIDNQGEVRLVLKVPKSEARELVSFFASNTEEPLQAALLRIPREVGERE